MAQTLEQIMQNTIGDLVRQLCERDIKIQQLTELLARKDELSTPSDGSFYHLQE